MKNITQKLRFDTWLVCVISVPVLMINFGPLLSLGAVFVKMMDTFQTDRAATAAVQSLLIAVTFTFGIISGALISRFGPVRMILVGSVLVPIGYCLSFFARHIVYLYVSIGIVSGVGTSVVYVSCIVVVERVFKGSQRLLCLALLNTSAVVTAIFYPYLLKWLTDLYGLNGMFLILGGLTLNNFVLLTVCRYCRSLNKSFQNHDAIHCKKESASASDTSVKRKKVAKELIFLCFSKAKGLFIVPYVLTLIANGLSLSSLDGYVGVMMDIALWKKLADSQGLISFAVYYSCTSVSCIIARLLKQKQGVNSLVYLICSTITGCVGQLIIIFTPNNTESLYMIGTALNGLAYGGVIGAGLNAVVQMVKPEQVPVAAGLLVSLEGLLAVGVGPLYGSVRDVSGTYKHVLVTVTCVQAVSAILFTLALITNGGRKNMMQQDKTTEIIATVEQRINSEQKTTQKALE